MEIEGKKETRKMGDLGRNRYSPQPHTHTHTHIHTHNTAISRLLSSSVVSVRYNSAPLHSNPLENSASQENSVRGKEGGKEGVRMAFGAEIDKPHFT